ncbi:MAG TPA: hypothetical protein VFQ13_03950 [Anaerolineales bacterium]|nr:hypothetical protein [Anaerolineales bacterium]
MDTSLLPRAFLENDLLRVDYLTTTGPRIIGLYAKGVEGNLLAETPDIHWTTPHGEFHLRGGHRLWIAPEDSFYICPEDDLKVLAEKDAVILRGSVDASGLEKEISFNLEKNRVLLTHRVTWHGNEPIELAPWGITQLRMGGMAILPLSAKEGLQPNRNLVLWPYSQVNDQRLELHDDLILIHGRASEQAFKVGNYNSHGWMAYLLDSALFVKRFPVERANKYPDMNCNVEVYVRDVCLEFEALGPLALLKPGESVTHSETWEVSLVNYSSTLEDARIISGQIT